MTRGQHSIDAREQVCFVVATALPDRPNRMDDVFRRQFEAGRYFRLSGGTAVESSAGVEQCGSGCAMNGAIDAAAAKQRLIGGVDDGIDIERRYIGFLCEQAD